jgi:3-dehydroquinate dehydratase-2
MKRILVINGPNLNLLGSREPEIYGSSGLDQIEDGMRQMVRDLEIELEFFQSNHEGDLIDMVHQSRGRADCIIVNAGGLTHYSVSLYDALKSVDIPVIEVHMTNIYRREEFRHKSYISPAAVGGVFGFGAASYYLALEAALRLLRVRGRVDYS